MRRSVSFTLFINAGAKLLTNAIEQILSDPSFETSSNEAKEARSCASRLLSWIKDESHKEDFETFSTELCTKLEPILTGRATLSANRDKMWRDFFILRSSDEFVTRWKTFLRASELSETPVFYQHVTDLVFRALLKQYCARATAGARESISISPTEANALRYAAGYVCRTISGRLRKCKASNSRELLDCVTTLVRDNEEKCDGESEEWTKLIDRGGLSKVKDNTFKVFYALEEEIRLSLNQMVLEPACSRKQKLVSQLVSSEDVKFYWSIASADFETDGKEVHDQVLRLIVDLFITVRGFAYTSTWTEKYKQGARKSTQRSKGLRGKLYTDKTN